MTGNDTGDCSVGARQWRNYEISNFAPNFLAFITVISYIIYIKLVNYNILRTKMAAITVNVEQSDKDTFNSICAKMGMNISTAINIFIKAVNRTRTIPFKIRAEEEYNDETLAACKEALDISKGKIKAKRYDSVKEMMNDMLAVAEDEPEYKP